MRLSLDHLTAVDATPVELAEEARAAGCDGVCLFLHAMEVLPLMPGFDLVADLPARRAVRERLSDLGLTLDLAYPFTLAGKTDMAALLPAIECAAQLNAQRINVLVYDRDAARREDRFSALCEVAEGFGLGVAVEFFPASQVRTLAEALDLVTPLARPGRVGINPDLLHLVRSGSSTQDLAAAPPGTILLGQVADGPLVRPEAEWAEEASGQRLVPGEGSFDIAGFIHALPDGCPLSVEVPRDAQVRAGVPRRQRVQSAVESLRRALEPRPA